MLRECRKEFLHLLILSLAYLLAFCLSRQGFSAVSGLVLLLAAVFLYGRDSREGKLALPGLLSLGLLGGEGVSCFHLSRLSTVWTMDTWLSFYLFILLFRVAFFAARILLRYPSPPAPAMISNGALSLAEPSDGDSSPAGHERGALSLTSPGGKSFSPAQSGEGQMLRSCRVAIVLLLSLSVLSFLIEAWKLGYVPFFTVDTPHAYSYFHLPGLHYFTTLVVLVPSVAMIYLRAGKKADAFVFLGMLVPLFLTVLMVSRFQFLFAVILMLFTGALMGERLRPWQMAILGAGMLSVYILITIARAHSVEYLNGIFEMKNPDTPIFITQPYMYIANNYDNYNVMTMLLPAHSHGMRMLYPFVTLTGLKFFLPMELAFPLYTTKEELTTVTLLYDAWYDFGLLGVAAFAGLLGVAAAFTDRLARQGRDAFALLIYAQLAFYFLFSFFTTWFSNPATWFYLGWSVLLGILVHWIRL